MSVSGNIVDTKVNDTAVEVGSKASIDTTLAKDNSCGALFHPGAAWTRESILWGCSSCSRPVLDKSV